MSDLISRQEAIAHIKQRLYETQLNNDTEHPYYEEIADNRIETWINELPSAEPTEESCWGCNCPKMERLKEQKTFSEMVHLHDLETNSCDTISRQAAIDAVEYITSSMSVCVNTDECHGMKRMQRQAVIELANLPSVQPEHTNADRIRAMSDEELACGLFKPRKMTNADRIRIMTNEELAHLLHSAEEHLFTGNLWNYEKWTGWLKQETEEV